jgi:hypothetical protein
MDSCRVSSDKNGFSLVKVLDIPPTMQTFPPHYSKLERELLTDAYQAITACDLWDWMKTYTPDKDKGFVFSTHPNLDRINAAMKYQGHSGGSYGWTMRTMEHSAKLGWNEALSPPWPCRKAKGFTFGWCGVAGGGVPGCEH